MIASPLGLQMSPVAMIVSRTHSVRCNYREPDMPMITSPRADDCKPLHVAAEIVEHLLRAAEWPFRIDDPFGMAQWGEILGERSRRLEWCEVVEEF